jgi:hypothetical protein
MRKSQQMLPKAPLRVASLLAVLDAVRRYLTERFPIASQGGTVLSGYVCAYLLYGQAHGHQAFAWATVVGGLSAVLLTLVRRLVDDIEDLRNDILRGRVPSAEAGRRYLRGLIVGAVSATALVATLNASCSVGLLAASVVVAVWFPLATVMKHTPLAQSSRIVYYVVNETCPVAGLLYSYAVWHDVSGATLPTGAVVAVVGLFWTIWQFWIFTRKVGLEGWPPWWLTMDGTRNALMVFLGLAGAFSVLIYHYANLPLGYLVYGVGVCAVFAAMILRWWSRLPAREPNRVRASWSGLPFAIAVEIGVLVGVLTSSL